MTASHTMEENQTVIPMSSLRTSPSRITSRDETHNQNYVDTQSLRSRISHLSTYSHTHNSASRQNSYRRDSAQSTRSQPYSPHRNRSRTRTAHPQKWHDDADVTTLNGRRPQHWNTDLSRIPKGFYRRLLGLNPFKTSYFSLYRPLRDLQSRLILTCGIVCAIAAGVPLPIIGIIFGHLINTFPPPEDTLLTSIEELIGVACAYFVVTWIWSVCWGIVGERVSRGLREALVERAIAMDLAYYDVEDPDITSILTGDTQTIQMGTSEKVGLFIQSISYFVAAFVVGFILNAKLTGVLFAAIIPTMVTVVVCGTRLVSKFSKRAAKMSEAAANVAEGAINAVEVVQAFGSVNVLSGDHLRIIRSAARTGFKKSLSGALMLGAVFFVAYAADSLAFYYGSQLTTDGAGTVYAVVFLILDASFVVGQFGPFIQTLALATSAGEKVLEILDRPEAPINVYSEEGKRVTKDNFKQDLVLKDVVFTYPARPTIQVLDQVSLRFKPGTTTGIVGGSGSGKSTIASLLLRGYDPTSGVVMLGDDDLKDLHIATLRSQIALVDQDPVLFTGTILQNISHGIQDKSSLSDEEIYERCTQAAAEANADFIGRLQHGIHTKIGGNGGTQLSGGQRQRICLARALIRRPALLILDEATSALDATSEQLILQALKKVTKSGCTVIAIAHRLATIKDADNIVVMGHGRFLEEGSHNSLIERNGAYKKLVEAQKLKASGGSSSSYALDSESEEFDDAEEEDAEEITFEGKVDADQQKEKETGEDVPQLGAWEIFKRCWAISKPEVLFIIIGVCASIISGGIILGEAIVFGHLVTILNAGSRSPTYHSDVNFYCLMFFVIALVALFTYSMSGTMFGHVSERLVTRIRDKSLRTILVQDISWFALPGHSPQELLAKLNMDSGHLSGLSGVIIGTICSVLTSVIGGLILALVVSWKIAIVIVATVPIIILAGFMRLRILSKFEERHETAYNAAAALASEACRSIRTVAAFGREAGVVAEYRAAVEEPYRQSFKFIVWANVILAFSYSAPYFIYALSYYWGSKQVRNGEYTEMQFFIVLPALLFSAKSAGQMFSLAPEVTRARAAANSVFALHDQKPTIMVDEDQPLASINNASSNPNTKDISTPSSTSTSASTSPEPPQKGTLTLDSVSLTYPARPNEPVLHSISLTIKPGQFIGLVGPSGAGKSTIISLLERFYDPTSGAVRIDGADIRTLPVRRYRRRLALVSQDPALFPGSVSFNVGLGAGSVPDQTRIEQVCRQCGIHDFITSLPEGYATECGNNGSKLSGGQRQRVAVARALLRDPEILLLDEATASLDSHSEREVQRAVKEAMKGRTTVVVAHRLSSVQFADWIFVFDKGRVVEEGRHGDLVGMGGVYAGMVKAQEVG